MFIGFKVDFWSYQITGGSSKLSISPFFKLILFCFYYAKQKIQSLIWDALIYYKCSKFIFNL